MTLWLSGANPEIRRVFYTHELKNQLVHYSSTIDEAVFALQKGS